MSESIKPSLKRVKTFLFLQEWRPIPLVFFLTVTGLLIGFPLVYGAHIRDVILTTVFLLCYVILPGVLFHLILFPYQRDWLHIFGFGWVLGFALMCIAFLLAKGIAFLQLFTFYPVVILPLGWFAYRVVQRGFAIEQPLTVAELLLLLIILWMAMEIMPVFSIQALWQESGRLQEDYLIHMGIASAVRHYDLNLHPHLAGWPLTYHFFSFTLYAGAGLVTQIPISELMLRLMPNMGIVLFVVILFNTGRMLMNNRTAGLFAAIMILFHADIGVVIARYFPQARGFTLLSSLGSTLYLSITTLYGLIFFLALAILIYQIMQATDRPVFSHYIALALLGFVMSGIKSSVLPVVIGGLTGVFAWRLVFQRHAAYHLLLMAVVLIVSSLPMSWFLLAAPGNQFSLFAILPGASVRSNPLFMRVQDGIAAWIQQPVPGQWVGWLILAVFPVWLVGYFGVTLVGSVIYIVQRRRISDIALWGIMTCLSGLVVALFLLFPGNSQLNFLQNGQVMLAILSGMGIVSLLRQRSSWKIPAAVVVFLFALPIFVMLVQQMRHAFYDDFSGLRSTFRPVDPLISQYEEGMDWIRRNTPGDAVLVADHDHILVSAYGERQAYFETSMTFFENASKMEEVFARRMAVREQVFVDPDPEMLEELVQTFGSVYLVFDDVEFYQDGGIGVNIRSIEGRSVPLPEGYGTLEFQNNAVQIYHLELPE